MSPEQLFPRPSREFLTLLAGLPKHLDAAMPMRRQHRRELPGDIRHLSHLLTDERGDLRRDYLADPAALSAYLRYFLPWNIYRLGVLFNGLALDPGGDNPDGAATIIDLGTGPLTAPLTLWMSRPHLRKRPLTFICVDRAPKPMRLGLDALNSLAASQGGLGPWKVTLVKGPLDARLREKADLLIMANALNEVLHRGEGEELLESADALAWHLAGMLTPTGTACVVEPGIRPSAHLIAALRRGFLHHGLKPVAPCPHEGPCPMSGRGFTAWCHFNFDAELAPNWLKTLSDEAKLPKDNVSLSFLTFSAKGRRLEAAPGKGLVRAVSGPFELPAPERSAPPRYGQYACSERGLTLLSLSRKHLVPLPGALIEASWPETPDTDAKSGAVVLPLGAEHLPARHPQPAPEGPVRKAPPARRETDSSKERPAARPRNPESDRADDARHAPARQTDDASPRPPKRAPGQTAKQTAKQVAKQAARQAAGPSAPARPAPTKAVTVDSLLTDEDFSAAESSAAEPKAERRKRLPSERPADQKRGPRKPTGKATGKDSRAARKGAGKIAKGPKES
jgi:Predicted rRNA methylase